MKPGKRRTVLVLAPARGVPVAGSVVTNCDGCGVRCWLSREGAAVMVDMRLCLSCAWDDADGQDAAVFKPAPGAVEAVTRAMRMRSRRGMN